MVDMTGLQGFYEVKLQWTPDPARSPEITDTARGPSIYTAVQEQLGLKLEARRGQTNVLVLDSVQRVAGDN